MLVLSRKEGERLLIGGNVVITVVALDGGRVKIGIDAPPEIGIQREEILTAPLGDKYPALEPKMHATKLYARRQSSFVGS